MSKKSTVTPVSMPALGSQFDDLFNDDIKGQPTKTNDLVAPSAAASTPPAAEPSKSGSKEKEPRKKKPSAKTSTPESPPETDQITPPPATSFSREELGWFFSNSAGMSQPKQLYVDENTKEALHGVAKAAGIPVGHLTDNIVRWFLLSNKSEITRIISRNRDPFNRLD